jgi:phosphate:Na+ symporter
LFQLVLDSVRLAQTVFISGDVRLARQLVEDKVVIKKAEREASSTTWRGYSLAFRKPSQPAICTWILSVTCGGLTLMTSIAYPILDDAGELRRSLLKPVRGEFGKQAAAGPSLPDDESEEGE